jgi:DNA-binding XRE family transcriptional regulator
MKQLTLPPDLAHEIVTTAARVGLSPREVALGRLRGNVTRMGRPPAPQGDLVKRVRLALNLSRADLAALIGVDPKRVGYFENAGVLPSDAGQMKTLQRLAKRHGVGLKSRAA